MNQEFTPPYSSLNKWFLYPFIAWLILGGFALLFYDRQILFAVVNTHHTSFLDELMVWITRMGEGVFGTIILLILLALKPFRNWWYFSAALLCNILPAILTHLVKESVVAPRPLNYFSDAPWIHYLPNWDRLLERSFPSGHTCAAFCLYCFLAFILNPKYKWLGAIFFLLATSVAYSRLYLAAHFFIDTYVGSIIGVLFTILVTILMRKYPHHFYRKKKLLTDS